MTAGSRIGFNYDVRIYLNDQAGFEFPPPPFGVGIGTLALSDSVDDDDYTPEPGDRGRG